MNYIFYCLRYQDWIVINDPKLRCWFGKKIPMREAYEWYFQGRIDFTRPVKIINSGFI